MTTSEVHGVISEIFKRKYFSKELKSIFLCIFSLIENSNVSLKNLPLSIINPLHLTVGGVGGCSIRKT